MFDEAFLRNLEHLALLTRKSAISGNQGERRSSQQGQSVEFSDFRAYVPGDDIRRIDWNAYARLERLFIKLFVDEQDITLHLLIDCSRSMDWGSPNKLDFAIRSAGALGYIALLGLDRVAIQVLGGRNSGSGLPPIRGKRNAIALFSFLTNLNSQSRRTLTQNRGSETRVFDPTNQLSLYAAKHRPNPAVLLSDLMDDEWQAGVNALASRGFEITLLHILSPEELAPDISGDYKLRDSENQSLIEITADFGTLEQYRQHVTDWQSNWNTFCRARGIVYIPISTETSIDELLFTKLRSEGVLR